MAGRHRLDQPGTWVLAGAIVAVAVILTVLVVLVVTRWPNGRAAAVPDAELQPAPTRTITSWPRGSTPTGPAPTPPPEEAR